MLSVMSSLVLAGSLLAQTGAPTGAQTAVKTAAQTAAQTPAVQSTAQPQAELVNAQGQPIVHPTTPTKPKTITSMLAQHAGRNAKQTKHVPAAAALVSRLKANQAAAAKAAAGEVRATGAQPRKPYQFTGPGWIKHPLSDAEQLRRFGAIVTPAPRGGEENQPELLSPEVRAELNAVTAAALQRPNPYGPRDACSDIAAAQSPANAQRMQPIGPAPLGGDDDITKPESLLKNEFWSQMPASGRVTAIACEPQIDTTPATKSVIIGTLGGGLWKTDNSLAGTATLWRNVSDSVTSDTRNISTFGAIAYAPSNSDIVYAADGSYLDLIQGSGLFRSSNGGASWTRIGSDFSGSNTVISQILVSPANPNVIYVGYSDSLQEGNGMLTRLEITYKPDGTINTITESIALGEDGAPINGAVTGLVWTATGYPLVAFDGLGVFLWIDDADVALQVGRSVIGRGVRDFRRIMLASNPAGTNFLAVLVGAGGELAQAVRCSSAELNGWVSLPRGGIGEFDTHGLPNTLATYGSLTGFAAINPLRPTQAIIGGLTPYFADAGMVITDNFQNDVVSSGETFEPTWYDMTRSLVTPNTALTAIDREKVVRSVHPYQSAAAWDSFGNLWIGHNGGVCMVAVDHLGTTRAPQYEDKNGGAAGLPERRPTVDAGALNTMLTISSSLSPHNTNLLVTGTEDNGVGEITFIRAADPDLPNPPQADFTAVTGDDEYKPNPETDPLTVRGRWVGNDVGPVVFDKRQKRGVSNGETHPAQLYMSVPNLGYDVLRRNGDPIEFPSDDPDSDPLTIEAGTIGEISGSWSIDRRDTYPPLVSAKLPAPTDDAVRNPQNDTIFSPLITGTSRLWMIADPAQYVVSNQNTGGVLSPGAHAEWQPIQASAALLIEVLTNNIFRRGTVTSIGYAKKQGNTADDLRTIWFTSTAGRLCRVVAAVDPDNPNQVIIDPDTQLPQYIQGQKVYPGAGESASLFRAADVAVNPMNRNEVYVCFRQPVELPNADNSGIGVARVAKVTVTPDVDIDGNPIEVFTSVPVSLTLPLGLAPRTIAVSWGTGSTPDVIYVGTGTGLWVSDNGGVSWQIADPVMPLAQVRDIELIAIDSDHAWSGLMAVSFYGRGVWISGQRTPACLADFNHDSDINLDDVDLFVNGWLEGCPSTDINLDGIVDFQDLDQFFDAFQKGLCS